MPQNYSSFLEQTLPQLINALQADTPALWGKMSAQHAIEHLSATVMLSNGKANVATVFEAEKAARWKQRFFEADVPFPRELRVPIVPENPAPCRFENIEIAKQKFMQEINRFASFFAENPDATPTHPTMGAMNHQEWLRFHARHCRHHFAQFGLIEELS